METVRKNFNPRSHKGSDHTVKDLRFYTDDFNPRSHKGSDEHRWEKKPDPHKFQSTLPQGERPYEDIGLDPVQVFQSTLPQGERLKIWKITAIETDFNPRSHKGSDSHRHFHTKQKGEFQSTLPQGERRESGSQMCLVHRDFNPRSHKGSDGGAGKEIRLDPDFNPRSHKGSDRSMRFYRRKKDISIHAPTRGATPHRGGLEEAMRISIHAPTRGATQQLPFILCRYNISIHAPTRGATGELRKPRRSRHNFNPRSHKGSDGVFCWLHEQQGKISIHAPTRGATILRHELIHAFLYISIHAPTRGATKWIPCCGQSAHISIHAPARGATNSASMMSALSLFQSTLPQGERQQFYTKFHICFISFLPILSPYHISTHSPLPTFNHFLYIFSGANRPEISCLLPFRTKTISGIL